MVNLKIYHAANLVQFSKESLLQLSLERSSWKYIEIKD